MAADSSEADETLLRPATRLSRGPCCCGCTQQQQQHSSKREEDAGNLQQGDNAKPVAAEQAVSCDVSELPC